MYARACKYFRERERKKMNNNNNNNNNQSQAQPSATDGTICGCCYKLPVDTVKFWFHFISIFNGLCIAFVGVMEVWAFGLNWTEDDASCNATKCCLKWKSFSKIFLPLYTVVAGLLLIIAEMRLNMCHERLSGNCGFLFSYNFRVLYILLSGTLCFSMECSQYVYVGYIAGSVSIMNAIFSCFMISNHPGMVQLTGHDDIDNARLLSNYGIGNNYGQMSKNPYAYQQQHDVEQQQQQQEGWGANYNNNNANVQQHEYNPFENQQNNNNLKTPLNKSSKNDNNTPKDGLYNNNNDNNNNNSKKEKVDEYLNPFASDNTF